MDNKLITLAVALVVGIILLGSLLVPVLKDTQQTIGAKVTYENENLTTNPYTYSKVDAVTASFDYEESTFTVNGNTFNRGALAYMAIVADTFEIEAKESTWTGPNAVNCYYGETTEAYPSTLEVSASNGVATLTINDTDVEVNYSWMYVIVPEGGQYHQHTASTNGAYCKSLSDVVIFGGKYSSGELDTVYTSYAGEVYVGVEEYQGTFNGTLTKVAGTTDIYQLGNATITITDGTDSETFTPYRALVINSVEGHEEEKAISALLGAIPVIILASFVIMAAALVINRRND